jgi:hypothetical protein
LCQANTLALGDRDRGYAACGQPFVSEKRISSIFDKLDLPESTGGHRPVLAYLDSDGSAAHPVGPPPPR